MFFIWFSFFIKYFEAVVSGLCNKGESLYFVMQGAMRRNDNVNSKKMGSYIG